MDRRKTIEYIIIALLIIALALLIWFLLRKDKVTEEPSPNDPNIVRQMPRAEQVFTPEQIANGTQGPEVTARIFAERFGSYSNQSGYGNIGDVLDLVTPELRTELEALRVAAEGELSESFYGVNTRVISISEPQDVEGGVTIAVQTQREEEIGSPGNAQVRYQELSLTLVQSGTTWLVADYAWSE